MGIRGELFSTKVSLQNRTYFFNVKENRMGDIYLNIVESKNREGGGFERQSVILFADDLSEFLKGFDESLRVMEKADREKRRGPKNKTLPPREGKSVPGEGRDRPGEGPKSRNKPVLVRKGGGKATPKKGGPPGEAGKKAARAKSVKAVKTQKTPRKDF